MVWPKYFFFLGASLSKTSKNILSNLSQELTGSWENVCFKSSLKRTELKFLYLQYSNSLVLFSKKQVYKTVTTNIWKSDKPVDTVSVCWKDKLLFVKKRSMQVGFVILLKHGLFLTREVMSWSYKKESMQGSVISDLKPPVSKTFP